MGKVKRAGKGAEDKRQMGEDIQRGTLCKGVLQEERDGGGEMMARLGLEVGH